VRNVACVQPEACQELHDGAVTPACNGFAITRGDQSAQLLGRQIPGHVGQLPMGVCRDHGVETCLPAAFDGEVPQERAQVGRFSTVPLPHLPGRSKK